MEGHFGAEDAGHQFVISDELNLTVAGVNQKDPWWNAPRVSEPCVRSQCKVLSLEITVHFYTLWKTQLCSCYRAALEMSHSHSVKTRCHHVMSTTGRSCLQ